MPDPASPLSAGQLYRAALERLRFEQSMGIEVLPRHDLAAPAAPAAHASATLPAAPRMEAPAPSLIPAGDVAARWAALEARVKVCEQCELHKGRTQTVFGVGNRSAELVFVGEAPGEDEDREGEPFVGRAGQLLNKIIGAMKWRREDVFICNTIKCRPPNNRPPLPDEISACNAFLVEQIELIQPKVIVALGSPAAKTLLCTTAGIMSLRGRWHAYRNIPVMPTYHPAFLLRQYTEENRRAVWEDMKKVADKLAEKT